MANFIAKVVLLAIAVLVFVPFAARIDQWPSPSEPGGMVAWMPILAMGPICCSLLLQVIRKRPLSRHPYARVGRWLLTGIAVAALLIIAVSELVAWDWERRGSPTAMGNLEMIPVIFGLFVGWIGFGAAGTISLIATVVALARPANQRLQLTGDARE